MAYRRTCAGYSLTIFFTCVLTLWSVSNSFCQELAVMRLVLNGEDMGDYFMVLAPDGDIWIKRLDLVSAGLKEAAGDSRTFDGEQYVSLRSVDGMNFRINEKDATLEITASAALFAKKNINIAYKKGQLSEHGKWFSAFMNYSLTYDHIEDSSATSLFSEIGTSYGNISGVTTLHSRITGGRFEARRVVTSLQYNDLSSLRTYTAGDFPASSGPLGSSLLVGGFNISKNFAIDPYYDKYPPIRIDGRIDTSSDVKLFMNGSEVENRHLSPGEFSFLNVPATVGHGEARVVINDRFRNETTFTVPYYYSDRLLKKGVHEFSYSIGFRRRNYLDDDFSYDDPVALVFHNTGVTNSLKIGFRAEASKGLINGGGQAAFLARRTGVVEASVAVSNCNGSKGLSGFIGYSYQSRDLNASLSVLSSSRRYSTVLLSPQDDREKVRINAAIGFGNRKIGFISSQYSYAESYLSGAASRISVTYNRLISERTGFYVTGSANDNGEETFDLFAGIHMYFGREIYSGISYYRGEESHSASAIIKKNPPSGTGFGYGAGIESLGDETLVSGHLQYQNNNGDYRLDYSNENSDTGFAFTASGGIGYINRSFFLSRAISDSFAKVRVGDLDDVTVYHYGNKVGKTHGGEFIIPDLKSFQENRIEIEGQDIPINYSIDTLKKYVITPYRGGVVIDFKVRKIKGAFGRILIRNGGETRPLELAGMTIQLRDRRLKGVIGRGGEFYIENVPPGAYKASAVKNGNECMFELKVPDNDELLTDLGTIICRGFK